MSTDDISCRNLRARRADAIRRVSGRGTDRDAACGDVIMNDDQAKKIKTDDSGASLIFFIYDKYFTYRACLPFG